MLINPYVFAKDPYFSNVSLLLHGNGANGSTIITDNSPSPKTVTVSGNAQISTAQSKFDGASLLFQADGTDYLTIPASSSLQVSAADNFTVEAWVYLLQNRTYNYILSKGNQATREWGFAVGPNNILFYWSTNGIGSGDSAVARSAVLPLNSWMHVAAVKTASAIKLFVNGIQQGSDGSFTSIFSGNEVLYVGRFMNYTSISHSINGYLDDIRITKGIARYTTNFTPPSAPFPDS